MRLFRPRGTMLAVLLCALAIELVSATRHGASTGQATASPSSGQPRNAVQIENALPGSGTWQLPIAPAGAIEGYSSETSVRPGSLLSLHVSTRPAATYRVNIFRLGWYHGAGARQIACLPGCSRQNEGTEQPVAAPDPSGEVGAGWPVSDEIRVTSEWVSGYYVAKLVLTGGAQQGTAATVPFIVRAPSSYRSTILVQAPVNTWQAYNNWGGKSLYDFNSSDGVPATRVSFNRPIVQESVLNYPFSWEYPLVRFLEREGYDVAYVTDVDTHRDPPELQKHRLVMTAGHDEYWSRETRDGFEAAASAQTNLAFMGGNTAYWQIRYDDRERTIVAYKSDADPIGDPAGKTVRFRDLQPPRPECQLLGVQSSGGLAAPGDPPRDYLPTSVAASDPWFAGTGLSASSALSKLVGYEWDVRNATCNVPSPTVLFHYDGSPSNADAVRYVTPHGSQVFSSGSLQFSWGLDAWGNHGHTVSRGLRQFMRNALTDLTR